MQKRCQVGKGQLYVRDTEKFAKMLCDGIGTAKAFDFGLLSLSLLH
jgi:CRISPR associated protein